MAHKIENFIPYLESRVLKTESISRIKKGQISENDQKGMCVASYWLDPEDEAKLLTTPVKETDIILEFIDIPLLHTYDDRSDEFFDALAEA